MATQKPISTISYNSEAFLREKLDTWVEAHIIQAYMYICHKGEDGDKDHIHVRIEPNKKLDPMDLQEALKEYVHDNSKPLWVRPFRPSKEEDWFMYVVHDPEYLKIKYGGGEKGEKLPYKWQDIKASSCYDVEVAFLRAKSKLEHTSANIATRLRNGESAMSMVSSGENAFTVGAVLRVMTKSDYERLSAEYERLKTQYDALLEAIDKAGFAVLVDENEQPYLQQVIPVDIDMEKAQMTLEDWDKCPEKEKI